MSDHGTYRVFISAVSSELGSYRDEVARVLRRRGLEVREQKHFRQGGATLLEALRDYICECDAVIHLVGTRCGALPTDEHMAVLSTLPRIQQYREKKSSIFSYTQSEFLMAKEFGKNTYVFITPDGGMPTAESPTETPDPPAETQEQQRAQQDYRQWIQNCGEHWAPLATPSQLIEDVLVLPFSVLAQPKPITLKQSMGSLFKGRESALEDLCRSLNSDGDVKATAIVGRAVHGLGGVGKSRLAIEYGWQHEDEYTGLFFVSADTPESLRRNLAELAGALVLNLPEKDAKEEEVRLAAALRWLQNHPKWFLILDNVDTEEAAKAVEEMLHRLHGGHVLITSRIQKWSGAIQPIDLDVLAEEDAAAFLLERTESKRTKSPTDEADAAELARTLDGLALALEQAGAYIVQRRLSFAKYLEAWRASEPKVLEWHDERVMDYPASVAVTWQTTMDQLNAEEIAFLRIFAWFAPEPIPLFVLEGEQAEEIWRKCVSALTEEDGMSRGSAADPREALANLADYSMLRWDADEETATVHRVVQQIVRHKIPETARKMWLEQSSTLLMEAAPFDADDVRTWPQWVPLAPHVESIVTEAAAANIAEPTATLMNQLGLFLRAQARYAEAEPLYRRALAIGEASYGPDHPTVATDCNNLAGLLRATNRLAEAEPLYRRALAIDEASHGPDHPTVAIRCNNL
ncbi:MAG: tetratricopeptide repeat protein, partial [Candidatus Hydrogenedentales bacterium]